MMWYSTAVGELIKYDSVFIPTMNQEMLIYHWGQNYHWLTNPMDNDENPDAACPAGCAALNFRHPSPLAGKKRPGFCPLFWLVQRLSACASTPPNSAIQRELPRAY